MGPSQADTLDSLFRIKDSARTSLSGALTPSSSSIAVPSTVAFPASGSIKIDDEIIYYASKSDTTFGSLTRGASGTAASTHANSALVTAPILAAHHNTLAEAVVCTEQLAMAAVPSTRTVNGHPLNANVTVTPVDLSLVIGTNVEAHDPDLTTIAGLSPSNDDLIQRKGGIWTNRTLAQVKIDLALNNVNNVNQIPLSYLDTDPALTANSDNRVASEKAVKKYVDDREGVSVVCAGTDDTTALFAGVTAAAGAFVTIADGQTCACSDLTIPNLRVVKGGLLKPLTSHTVTLENFEAGPYRAFINALAGQGTVTFQGTLSMKELNPKWWGATAGGVADDQPYIQAAADAAPAAGGDVVLNMGVWGIAGPVSLKNSVTLRGTGDSGTEVRALAAFSGAAGIQNKFQDGSQQTANVVDLQFNGNKSVATVPIGILFKGLGQLSRISNVKIRDVSGKGLVLDGGPAQSSAGYYVNNSAVAGSGDDNITVQGPIQAVTLDTITSEFMPSEKAAFRLNGTDGSEGRVGIWILNGHAEGDPMTEQMDVIVVDINNMNSVRIDGLDYVGANATTGDLVRIRGTSTDVTLNGLRAQSLQNIINNQINGRVFTVASHPYYGHYSTGTETMDGVVTLPDSGATAGSYGSASQVGAFTVSADGRLTAAANVTISIPYSAVTSRDVVDADINPSAAIAWTKISKSGSSLADLATRNASDLNAGTLNAGRFPALTGDVITTIGTVATTIANAVVNSAKLNITTTSCTNQVVTSISSGAVGTCSSVSNAMLTNSTFTIGSTSVSLGGTSSTIAGLTLTTPTIASFINATHNHQDAAGGGALVGASALSDYATAFVNSLTGTANQVNASASAGGVTLSLPQSIATGSSPQFARLGLSQAPDAAIKLAITPISYDTGKDGIQFTSSDNTAHSIIQPIKITSNVTNLFLGSNAYVNTGGTAVRANTSFPGAAITVSGYDGTILLLTGSGADPVSRARLDSAGNFKLAGTATRGTTEGTNHFSIFDGTAPAGTLANGIDLYSTSGELRVMDAGGNATLLSSHDHKTNEWIFYSVNTVTGKVLKIDMERMMRALDKKLGGGFVHEYMNETEARPDLRKEGLKQ